MINKNNAFKTCVKCKLTKYKNDFYTYIGSNKKIYYRNKCKKCSNEQRLNWSHDTNRSLFMGEDRTKAVFLGVYVAERILSKYFKEIIRMPYGNKGYDYICNKGYKIDVKSSCLIIRGKFKNTYWVFNSGNNTIADYFLCLGFNNRDDLEPQHIWLIPGNVVNSKTCFNIPTTNKGLLKWSKYEKSLDKVVECCNALKNSE